MKIDPYNTNGENLSPDKYFYLADNAVLCILRCFHNVLLVVWLKEWFWTSHLTLVIAANRKCLVDKHRSNCNFLPGRNEERWRVQHKTLRIFGRGEWMSSSCLCVKSPHATDVQYMRLCIQRACMCHFYAICFGVYLFKCVNVVF